MQRWCEEETREKLYELEAIEKDRQNRRVKVHYVGYESKYNEWQDEDIKTIYSLKSKLVLLISHCVFVHKFCYVKRPFRLVTSCTSLSHPSSCYAMRN